MSWMKLEVKKYMRVFWELYPIVDYNFQALMLICYIIDTYDILKETITINGLEYRRLSDSFIQERLDITHPTIKKYLDLLEEKNLIKTHLDKGKHTRFARYINLQIELIESSDTSYETGYKNSCETGYEIGYENNFQENILTNQHTNKPTVDTDKQVKSVNDNFTPISEPTTCSAPQNNNDIGESPSAVMVRSQVYGAYEKDVADVIVKWYNTIGFKRKFTFNQIKDKYEQLSKDCNGDKKLVIQQINYSYLNGYPGWYPPDVKKNQKSNSSNLIYGKAKIKKEN